MNAEDGCSRTLPKQPASTFFTADPRLSVQALLARPSDDRFRAYTPESLPDEQTPVRDHGTTTYGYDRGCPDLDIPKNDDDNAITMFTPPSETMDYEDGGPYGIAETRAKHMAFSKGGYYANPVPIVIPKSLEPLPPLLVENPMNLIYFHHFLNHTARILVPHDCEKNPFRHILPEMAVRDENILHLLLAFSASHRARLLNHPEPVNRIALWVQDVFPKLRAALTNSNKISNSTLAPSLMMASLEIMSPNTFEMIIARGGPRSLNGQDRVAYFLSRWFAYLDVLGSLSGNKNDLPLASYYWSSEDAVADEDYQIDCLTGFTNHCVGTLARVAELAMQCEPQRIDETGNIREGWQPAPEIVEQAEKVRRELQNGINNPTIKSCSHRAADSTESEMACDTIEIHAANEMFHWAGLIHLFRRVLGKSTMDPEVQNAVRQIIHLLYKVRRGGTAEACLLFPMFAAGCEATNEGQREKIIERLRCVEGFGIAQVRKARSLMQKVWDTGKPWESLVSGEFFG
ncbi:C6 zinc finger domain-containing protein [Westerdykella ornata]|uniref:C6 zinc finger domain-containing protein n=1 Tax=Westerdykella ornata TaxID=318751 RepID=A0A6A6K080_WESOR|nr:C6 zinc finger domain-containing protein [Westerdykella ornata]KAF2280749.1 C6 zinc finger domain-containing protein [Westerdykella ornata]